MCCFVVGLLALHWFNPCPGPDPRTEVIDLLVALSPLFSPPLTYQSQSQSQSLLTVTDHPFALFFIFIFSPP